VERNPKGIWSAIQTAFWEAPIFSGRITGNPDRAAGSVPGNTQGDWFLFGAEQGGFQSVMPTSQ
jgi:hypothetical protein